MNYGRTSLNYPVSEVAALVSDSQSQAG